MKKPLLILMLGLLALTTALNAQIKLWNNGGIAIGDTTDPGSEKTVFHDDVEFNGTVTGISNIDADNTVNVNKDIFNITSTGWWQVAETNGGDHAMAIINVVDYLSSTHTSAKYLVTFQHGQGQIVQLIGDTYSQHGLTGVRLMYNTSDRVYGGARFEVQFNKTGNFHISIEDYNTTYSYSEWVLLSSAEQESGWSLLSSLGGPGYFPFATAGKVKLGYDQTGDVLTIGSSNAANSEGGLLLQASSAGSSYFRYNRMGSWAGKTLIGNNASTTSDSPTTAIEIDGTSGSNVINMLGDLNMSAAKDVSLSDNSGLRFGDATKGIRMYSDGTYLRLNKGSATSALPFLLEQPTSYLYSDNLYLGWSSGDNIHFRENTVTATNWGITPAGTLNAVKVGIGTSSPLRPLTVSTNGYMQMWEAPGGTANYKRLSLYCNSGTDVYRFIRTTDADGFGSDILSMDLGNGNVGIGDSTPTYKLDVNGTGRFTGLLRADAGLSTYGGNTSIYSSVEADTRLTLNVASGSLAQIYYYDQGDTQFQDLRIGSSAANNGLFYDASSSRIGINDDSPSYTFDVNGTGRFTSSLTASSLTLSSGHSVTGTASFFSQIMAYHDLTVYGTFTEMSDRTLKTDIKELDVNSLDKITSLQGVTYRFIEDEKRTTRTGFIAQEVQKVFPGLVAEKEDGLAIKTLEIIPHLVEAIKDQQEIIDNLEARLQALEGK